MTYFCSGVLTRRFARAKTLKFEYPSYSGEHVLDFDLSGLAEKLANIADSCDWKGHDIAVTKARQEAVARQEKNSADATAWRAEISLPVHECRREDLQGQWCWTDPSDPDSVYATEIQGFPTQEAAFADALENAKAGLTFSNVPGLPDPY